MSAQDASATPPPPPPGPAPIPETPHLAAARQARLDLEQLRAAAVAVEARLPPPPAIHDPVATCVWATVVLIAWVASPPLALAGFGAYGVWRYAAAWRAGLRRSDCVLRDPRLVMLYLGLLAAAGLAAAAARWARWLR